MEMTVCKLCASPEIQTNTWPNRPMTIVECPRCGQYVLSNEAFWSQPLVRDGSLPLLSAAVREYWDANSERIEITTSNAQSFADSVVVPTNDNEYVGLILGLIAKRQSSVSQYAELDMMHDYPAIKLTTMDDFVYFFDQAKDRRLVEQRGYSGWIFLVRLTPVGRTFLENVSRAPAVKVDSPLTLSINDEDTNIATNLSKLDKRLGDMFRQIISDVSDRPRLTWSAPFHDLREILRKLLDILAPDDKVIATNWYTRDKDTNGPTQAQRAKFVLRARRAGGNEEDETIKNVELIEARFGMSGRTLYARSAGNAHGDPDRDEFFRVLRYFRAVVHDLLDIKG